MSPWPYSVGELLQLEIEFPAALPTSRELKAALTVGYVVTSDDNPDDIFTVTVSAVTIGRSIQFHFDIPLGLPRSSQVRDAVGTDTARWLLTVTSSDSRWDFRAVYVLAVCD